MQQPAKTRKQDLIERSLAAFVQAGTIDLSLDQLAASVRVSKRMLIHYFGNRETLEESAMALLEERLRAQFAPESFPANASLDDVVSALWERTTAPAAKGVLRLIMDLSRRAWNGSARARAFYAEQQRQWVQLLIRFCPDQGAVEQVLQLFQGAVLAYLIAGDPQPGRRALSRALAGTRAAGGNPRSSKRPDGQG